MLSDREQPLVGTDQAMIELDPELEGELAAEYARRAAAGDGPRVVDPSGEEIPA